MRNIVAASRVADASWRSSNASAIVMTMTMLKPARTSSRYPVRGSSRPDRVLAIGQPMSIVETVAPA
jgi:hypothetical protein